MDKLDTSRLYYFGTALNVAGHYFWDIERGFRRAQIAFIDIPFNPYFAQAIKPGEHLFTVINQINVLCIGGSCYDTRGGTVTTFFSQEDLTQDEMIERIRNNQWAMSIINQMPFDGPIITQIRNAK